MLNLKRPRHTPTLRIPALRDGLWNCSNRGKVEVARCLYVLQASAAACRAVRRCSRLQLIRLGRPRLEHALGPRWIVLESVDRLP